MAITKIVEQCRVTPSPDSVAEKLLPLLYVDIVFVHQNFMELLLFYSLPSCSESQFFDTIVPTLKNSLSLTLKHFIPLAGKIVFPLTTGMPLSHYITGDSISMAIAVSDADFTHLSGNHSRDSDQFHDFAARLPPPTRFPDFIKFSTAATQVTLFPNQGICIGIAHHHAIGDGGTALRFVHTWASITKFKGDAHLLPTGHKYLPFYDRSRVEAADSLATAFWEVVKTRPPTVASSNPVPTNKVRAKLVLSEARVEKLIKFVTDKKPSLAGVSTFSVVGALVWTSLARLARATGEGVADDEAEYFSCMADCRERLNPPLPATYFGNCLAFVVAELSHGRLKGGQGIVLGAEAIWEAIQKTVNNEKGVLDGAMDRYLELERIQRVGNRILWIAGSTRFDAYAADFGWGRMKNFELVHNDHTGSIAIFKSAELKGGVEVGLSMGKPKMDAFAAIFNRAVEEATQDKFNHLSKL